MAITLAVINRKGGTGKTTTALCLAESLRRRGARTLLVDLDQQHNATRQYGARIEGITTVYDLMTDAGADVYEAVQHCESGDIIAGDDLMNNIEVDMASMLSRETMLADALGKLDGDFDYIVIDCSPTLGIAAVNVLVAADHVVVPVECDRYSAEGYEGLHELIKRVQGNRRLNPGLKVAGLLVTKYEARPKISRSMLADLKRSAEQGGTRVFDTAVRRCCKVREAQDAGVPLGEYAPECTTARDYEGWVDELMPLIR